MDFEYHSFLLRLWVKGKSDDKPRWMVSLEDASTNDKYVFSSIEELIDFLKVISSDDGCRQSKGGVVSESEE